MGKQTIINISYFINWIIIPLACISFNSGCKGKDDQNNSDDNRVFEMQKVVAKPAPYTSPSSHSPISDGEREHHPSTKEIEKLSSRGISSLEDAYLLGYDDGYEAGEDDGAHGVDFGLSYDPEDGDLSIPYAESYEEGYQAGYHDGYHSNYKIYVEDEEEEDELDDF